MHYDFFVAGRYRNKENVANLVDNIRSKGKSAYCFLESPAIKKYVTDSSTDAETGAAHFEKLDDWWNNSVVREVFDTDMDGLRASDTFVLLLPAGKSVHIEAGVAFGLQKKCILIGEQKEAESLYLIFDEHYETAEEFMETLR